MLDLLGVDALATGLAVVVGAIVAVWGLMFKAKRDGREQERQRRERETLDRLERGRDAVRDGRGLDPAERLRRNDGQW